MESQTPLTISAEYGLIDQNKFFGKRIAAKDLSNYYLIQKGEFAYNKSTSNDAPWGAIKRLDCYNNGALSTLYIVFKIKDNKSCYSDFLVTYYGTSLWHKGVKEIATEGARNHGLLNVSPSDFFRTKLVIPQDFEEQRKIGAFFTQLDNTITLQQRKLNSLQKLKKGLLQKMFPKNGENIPEIRFPEFSDAWKQRKFSEVFEEYSEKKHPELPALTIIQGKGTILRDASDRNLLYDKANLASYKLVRKDDFIVHLRTFEGGLEKANSDGIVSPAYHIFHGKNTDTRFFYPFFRSKYFIDALLKPHVYGIRDGKSIDIEGMKTISFLVPSFEEQNKIGKFVETLDNTITLQQRWLFYTHKQS